MIGFDIRAASETDLKRLAALEREIFSEAKASPALLADSVGESSVGGFLGGRAGEPAAGFAIWRIAADEAELLSIGVVAPARKSGLGAALLAAVETAARNAGAKTLHLEVDAANAAAIALYERAGAAATGRRPDYYGPGRDAVLMRMGL